MTAVTFHTAYAHFKYPDALRDLAERHGFTGRTDEDLLVGEASFGISFCKPRPARTMGDRDAPDFAKNFDDSFHFEARVSQVTGGLAGFFSRMDPPLADTQVCGLAVLENLLTAPGFNKWDILDRSLAMLSTLLVGSSSDLLFLHSEQDRLTSRTALWNSMAEQAAFRRRHPDWKITTFPRIGPAAASMAGLIPAGGSTDLDQTWIPIGSSHPAAADPDKNPGHAP